MSAQFDPGPPHAIAQLCARCPSPAKPQAFWTDWGPVFYRGRLDGSETFEIRAQRLGLTSNVCDSCGSACGTRIVPLGGVQNEALRCARRSVRTCDPAAAH
jgi:hypothetical protein